MSDAKVVEYCCCGNSAEFLEGPYPVCRCPHPTYKIVCPVCNRVAFGGDATQAIDVWNVLIRSWRDLERAIGLTKEA